MRVPRSSVHIRVFARDVMLRGLNCDDIRGEGAVVFFVGTRRVYSQPGADVNVWCETKWTTQPLTMLKHTAMATTGIVVLDMERVRG